MIRLRKLYPDWLYVARKWTPQGGGSSGAKWEVIPINASFQGYNKGVIQQGDSGLNFAQLDMYSLYTREWLHAYTNFPVEGEGEFSGLYNYDADLVWLPKTNAWHMVQGHIDFDVRAARKRLRHGEYVLQQLVDSSLVPPVTLPDYDQGDVIAFERVTRKLHNLVISDEWSEAWA